MTCRLTVVVPTYNGLRYLVPCLDALHAQTYQPFRVVVVDDGSTDGTASVLASRYPEVGLIRFATNGGLACAQNAGFAATDTEFVAFLNNDTEADPAWLERLIAAADAHPRAWAVAGKLRLWDRRTILHAAGDGFGTDGVPRNLGVWEQDDGQWDGGRWIWGPQGGAALYRRSALLALSDDMLGTPFDESFFMYCEDVDLNWRARLVGFETAFASDAVVFHHLSATAGGALASYYVGRNMLAVLIKDVPGATLKRYGWRMMEAQMRFAGESVRHCREPAARARLRGQLAVVAMLPRLLRQRRQVAARRTASIATLDVLLYAPEREYARIPAHGRRGDG
ncbi:MAG: glycosyltransferase family 2 protein [Chloroflexota bacterium]|nr:glycosyltransferase family 2 protein [Chloroflexota bacterium]